MSDKEPYATSNTTLAAYLLYHGHEFVGIIPDKFDRRRLIFAFIKQENTETLAQDFLFGDPQVDPKKFHRMLKNANKIVVEEKERTKNV